MNYKQGLAALLLSTSIFLTGCAENPADKVPDATVGTPAATGTPVAGGTPAPKADGTVYNFGNGAEVGFVGSKVTGSHSGGFKNVTGKVTVPGDEVEKGAIDIVIDMTSTYSDDEKLTSHLKGEDFFDVGNHPQTTFVGKSITKADKGYTVSGDLTLRGTTREISFPAMISVEGDALKTSAEFSIKRKDFGIVYPGKPDNLIRDEVVIKFDITANKA